MSTLDAGEFGAWLERARGVLRGEGESDVPCGDCTGCCRASWYIRIRPKDRPAIVGLAQAYLVKPDNIEAGDSLLAWREDGSCPMLVNERCTIYAQRPMTCRDFDCRVFTAAGLETGDERRATIDARVRAWRFSYTSEHSRRLHEAVRRAAAFIRERRESFPDRGRALPVQATGIAVLAIKACEVFLDEDLHTLDDEAIARRMVQVGRRFDAAATG